jgi:anti-sigma factor RsiW
MNSAFKNTESGATPCDPRLEETLNHYLDGELTFDQQPVLFAHLAACDPCRRTLAATMDFRRMSRQEVVSVPGAVDDTFFQRLDQLKHRTDRLNRSADRRPLWNSRTPISLRAASALALVLFLAGFFFPQHISDSLEVPLGVEGVGERVELPPVPPFRSEAVYVFYPGLTVEAQRDAGSASEPL